MKRDGSGELKDNYETEDGSDLFVEHNNPRM